MQRNPRQEYHMSYNTIAPHTVLHLSFKLRVPPNVLLAKSQEAATSIGSARGLIWKLWLVQGIPGVGQTYRLNAVAAPVGGMGVRVTLRGVRLPRRRPPAARALRAGRPARQRRAGGTSLRETWRNFTPDCPGHPSDQGDLKGAGSLSCCVTPLRLLAWPR